MFAAYKRNVAKRKAARALATTKFHARIAEINQKRDIELALIEIEQEANKEKLHQRLSDNNAKLKEAWSR